MDPNVPAAFHRVWQSMTGRTETDHQQFHFDLWNARENGDRVAEVVQKELLKAHAKPEDKRVVIDCLSSDWRTARVLATFASSATCWSAGDFPDRLEQLMAAASVSVAELAEGIGINRQAVYKLLNRESKPTWATVEKIASFLGVSTDAFRSAKPAAGEEGS